MSQTSLGCGAEEGLTQPLESGPATQDDITDDNIDDDDDDDDDDDEVLIVTY